MRWLAHGNITAAVTEALKRHGHEATPPADIGIPTDADAPAVLDAAHSKQLDLITADGDLAHAPFTSGRRFARSLVFLNVGPGDVEQDDAVDRLFTRYPRLTPGRLYTVTGSRVKIRQLPSHLG